MSTKRRLPAKANEPVEPSTNDGPVYFWKPDQPNGYLGQWYPSKFTVVEKDAKGEDVEIRYMNGEQ